MHVVVNVLASKSTLHLTRLLAVHALSRVSVLCLLLGKSLLHGGIVAVLEAAVLDRDDVVVVLLWQGLTVVHRLLRGVVVVLVDLLVDGGLKLLLLAALNGLVLDCWCDFLVDSGVVVARLGHELEEGVSMPCHSQQRPLYIIYSRP